MALAGKVAAEIGKYGGGVVKVQEVNFDGSQLAVPGTVQDLGYINDFGVVGSVSDNSATVDETGDTIAYDAGKKIWKLTGTIMQTSKAMFDFFNTLIGKYFSIYYKATKTGAYNGKTQEYFIPIAVIDPTFESKANTKRSPFTATILNNANNITMSTTLFGAVTTQLSTVVTANSQLGMIEG